MLLNQSLLGIDFQLIHSSSIYSNYLLVIILSYGFNLNNLISAVTKQLIISDLNDLISFTVTSCQVLFACQIWLP